MQLSGLTGTLHKILYVYLPSFKPYCGRPRTRLFYSQPYIHHDTIISLEGTQGDFIYSSHCESTIRRKKIMVMLLMNIVQHLFCFVLGW